MMLADSKKLEIEFIKRTRQNLSKYCGKYEVTNLINSMIGLLVVPKERLQAEIGTVNIPLILLDKMKNSIVENSYKEEQNLAYFVRHLRNAVSHFRLSFKGEESLSLDEPPSITHIVMEDNDARTGERCLIVLPVELLKTFLEVLSDVLLVGIE